MNKEKQIYPILEDNPFPILISSQPEVFSRIEPNIQENFERRKNKKIPIKTCIASIFLNTIGITFFSLSIDFFIEHKNHEGALPMLILSLLSLTPGIYSGITLYGGIRGWNGYHIDSVPSYEIL